jgi:hypothetical protein
MEFEITDDEKTLLNLIGYAVVPIPEGFIGKLPDSPWTRFFYQENSAWEWCMNNYRFNGNGQ